MSGQIRQYSPRSRTYVPRGSDGRFSPKVLSQQKADRPQEVQVLSYPPRSSGPPKVLLLNQQER